MSKPIENSIAPDSSPQRDEIVDNSLTNSEPHSRLRGATRHLIIGAGQVGKALERALAGLKFPVRMLTRPEFSLESPEEIERTFSGEEFDYVWLTAAETRVDWCEDNSEFVMKVNGNAPGVISKICASHSAKLFYFSTDYVFSGIENGEPRRVPYQESDRPLPLSVYGASKLNGEYAVLLANPEATVIRTSGIFSASGRNFFTAILNRAKLGKQFDVVGDQITSPTYAPHLGIWLASRHRELPVGVVHLAASGGCSWYEAARAALGLVGISTSLVNEITSENLERKAKRPCFSVLGSNVLAHCGLPGLPVWLEGIAAWASDLEERDSSLLP